MLLAEYAAKIGDCVVVKGLRAISDFEKEFQMALINKKINPNIETLFLTSSEKYTFLSSSVVREMASYGAELKEFIPYEIIEDVEKKIESRRNKYWRAEFLNLLKCFIPWYPMRGACRWARKNA